MIPVTWDGESFVPARGFSKRCDERFVVGERYVIDVIEERSAQSHRHFFAAVREAWSNLPDGLSEQFRSPEALRKFALIKSGFCSARQVVCSSPEEAARVGEFIAPMDEYALVTINGPVVTVWSAMSQNMQSMGKKVFQESKEAVLRVVSEMIGTDAATLSARGEAA